MLIKFIDAKHNDGTITTFDNVLYVEPSEDAPMTYVLTIFDAPEEKTISDVYLYSVDYK